MVTDTIFSLATYMLAVSLATERLLAFIKTIFPKLAKEPLDSNGFIDEEKERIRTLRLQAISLLCALITSFLLTEPGSFVLCIDKRDGLCLPFWFVAVLGTGGSTFWSNVLGYINAVKDIKKQERAKQRLDLANQTKSLGISINNISTL